MNNKEKINTIKQELIKLTSEFCSKYLDEEYKKLSEKLILKMSRKRNVPFLSGRINVWAAGVIYSLGQVNFLFDKSFEPYVTPDDICNYFETSKSTTSQKAKIIRDMFKMDYWNSEFATEMMKKNNPLNDIVMVNGLAIPKDMLFELIEAELLPLPD